MNLQNVCMDYLFTLFQNKEGNIFPPAEWLLEESIFLKFCFVEVYRMLIILLTHFNNWGG